MNMKSKIIVLNLCNVSAVLLMLISFWLISVPASTYLHSTIALLSYPLALYFAFANMGICIVAAINMFIKRSFRIVAVVSCIISICLFWFAFDTFFPWARYSIHFPTPQGVCWRENALSDLRDNITWYTEENMGNVPAEDNWKELLVSAGYEDIFEEWNAHFNSSILLNNNIKGLELDKLEHDTVLLFEGPKGKAFGDERTFRQFAEENEHVYIVLVRGDAGRVTWKAGKIQKPQSLFGGLNNDDLPLKWK